NGDIGRFGALYGPMVLVNSPELVHEVLVTRARCFEKSPIVRGALFPLAGNGLFTSEGELWRSQRKLMAPLLNAASVSAFSRHMIECASEVARRWRDGQTVDVAHETTSIAMSIAGRALFGMDTISETDEIGHALTVALEWTGEQATSLDFILQIRALLNAERWLAHVPALLRSPLRSVADGLKRPVLWPGRKTRALKAALAVRDARVARLIAERRAGSEQRKDLLALLLDARDDNGRAMSERQVRDEILTLFIAGHETSASAIGWALMLLAQHPDVYRRVRAELDALGRAPAHDDLPALALTQRVFKEALRLYPPLWMFARVSTVEVPVGEYLFPAGTIVIVSPYALQRRPELWPEPERFDPDRFTPELEAVRHRAAFIPFGAGPRTCIGNFFALMEGPLALGTLLHHADFALVHAAGSPAVANATLRAADGIPMRVHLRRSARASRPPAARSSVERASPAPSG
ncbi:MAG: cytochrome P450, partial [Polyangiaceae bacterium]